MNHDGEGAEAPGGIGAGEPGPEDPEKESTNSDPNLEKNNSENEEQPQTSEPVEEQPTAPSEESKNSNAGGDHVVDGAK